MELALELRKLLGDEIIADDPEVLAAHSGDKWFAARQPEVVVFAKSTNDVSKLLKSVSPTQWRSSNLACSPPN